MTNYLGAAPSYCARWLSWERGLLDQWRAAPASQRPRPVVTLGTVAPAFVEAFTALTQSLDDPALPAAVVGHRAQEMLVWLEGAGRLLLDVRMSTALTLLQSTAQPVTRIAGEVGYQSPSQFAVRFRQRFGCSPTDIRGDSPRDMVALA